MAGGYHGPNKPEGFIPQYSSDSEAPDGTQYFNTSDDTVKYKDSNGNIIIPSAGTSNEYVLASQFVLGGR